MSGSEERTSNDQDIERCRRIGISTAILASCPYCKAKVWSSCRGGQGDGMANMHQERITKYLKESGWYDSVKEPIL